MATEVLGPVTQQSATEVPLDPKEKEKEEQDAATGSTTDNGAESQTAEAQISPEPETEPDLDEQPEGSGDFEKFKAVLDAHPDFKTELKQIIGREKAYSELGSFSEVRSIVERIPTLEDAETLVSDAENKRELGRTFRESPEEFNYSLKESDPLAYQKYVQSMPEILASESPDLWATQARSYVGTVLTNLYGIARQANDETLLAAVQAVANSPHLGIPIGSTGAAPQRVNSETERLRRELEERNQRDKDSAYNSFHQTADNVFTDSMITEIESQVKKSLPTANDSALKILVPRIWESVKDLMRRQPQTAAQVESILESARKGRAGQAELRQLTDILIRKGKASLPGALKAELKEWTSAAVTTNNQKVTKQQQVAAATRDAGSGASASTSAANNTPQKRQSKEDVWKALEAKTYQKPA